MSGAGRVIRWSTAFAVLGVAAVAAVASYEHAYDLVRPTASQAARPAWCTSTGTSIAEPTVLAELIRRGDRPER
jgi:hypothetical protein